MKRVLKMLALMLLCISVIGAVMVGCTGPNGLEYGEKYYSEYYLEEEENEREYLIFDRDGTGYYRYSYDEELEGSNKFRTTIKFKYFISDDTLICVYDSHTTVSETDYRFDRWSMKFGVADGILVQINTSSTLWFPENKLDEIPNFRQAE